MPSGAVLIQVTVQPPWRKSNPVHHLDPGWAVLYTHTRNMETWWPKISHSTTAEVSPTASYSGITQTVQLQEHSRPLNIPPSLWSTWWVTKVNRTLEFHLMGWMWGQWIGWHVILHQKLVVALGLSAVLSPLSRYHQPGTLCHHVVHYM